MSQAAASLRLCDFHRRAGMRVPAVQFVGAEAFCAGCWCARRRRDRIHAVHAPQNNKKKSQRGAPLSPREVQVVRLIVEGLCTKEIAAEMNITVRTVKFFLAALFAKTGTRDQRGLLLWSLKARRARLRDSLDRIEGELGILSSVVHEKLERDIGAAASVRHCVAEIESAFEVLKVSLGNDLPLS